MGYCGQGANPVPCTLDENTVSQEGPVKNRKSSSPKPSGHKPSFSKPSFSKPSSSIKPGLKFGSKPPDTPNMMKGQGGYADQGMGYRPSFWQRRYGPRGGCGCTTILVGLFLALVCLGFVVLYVFGNQILHALGIG
jgi:hypothetical protein